MLQTFVLAKCSCCTAQVDVARDETSQPAQIDRARLRSTACQQCSLAKEVCVHPVKPAAAMQHKHKDVAASPVKEIEHSYYWGEGIGHCMYCTFASM